MKNKSLMLLLVAAGCGLVAMIGVQQMLSGGKPAAKTQILVARAEIEAGVELDKTNVGFKEWPSDSIPEGAIQTEEQFAERSLKHRVGPGQPILLPELGNKGEFGPEIQIPKNMRLVSVAVTATMVHSGLLRPGNFVDVSAAIEVSVRNGQKRVEVKPVLECVKVFAVDSQIAGSVESKDAKAKEIKNVSFLVYPMQGQLLQLANKQSNGQLQFALRSGSDKTLEHLGDLDEDSLNSMRNSLQGYADEPPVAEKPLVVEKPPIVEQPVVAAAKPKSAFRSYLAPETSPAMVSVGDQAVRQTWKIEIFQGDQREVQELELTDEELRAAQLSNPGKLFNQRKNDEKGNAVEAQPTSLIRRKYAAEPAIDESRIQDPLESDDQ